MQGRSCHRMGGLLTALFLAVSAIATPAPLLAEETIGQAPTSQEQLSPQPTALAGSFRSAAGDSVTCPNPTPVIQGMTAALINPSAVSGTVDATGCDIGVYFAPGTRGTVTKADIHGAGSFGIYSNGAFVNVTDSQIHDILGSGGCEDESSEGDSCSGGSESGTDQVKKYIGGRNGTGILFLGRGATGVISGNQIFNYGKRGIAISGLGAGAQIVNNTITGQWGGSAGGKHTGFTGIWVANGGSGIIDYNRIADNGSIATEGAPSRGIMVVGGTGHDGMPNYSTGLEITGNTLTRNDVGVFLSNIPINANVPTRIHVANNVLRAGDGTPNGTISEDGTPRFAAIKELGGNGDDVENNAVTGYTTPIYFTPIQYTYHTSLVDVRQSPAFTTGIQIQNPNTTLANLAIVYRDQSDTEVTSKALQIAENSSATLYGASLALPEGFVGSAEITSDQPIEAIANILGLNPTSGEAYNGSTNPATILRIPLFQQDNNGFSSSIDILNTAATPNIITVTFNEHGADHAPLTFTLPANGRISIDKSNDAITSKFIGSATVLAQQPVAVEVDQSNGVTLLAESGMSVGSATLYVPLIMTNNNGWTTGLQVQNGGSESTTVSLFLDGGAIPVTTASLGPGQSVTWYPVPGTTGARHYVGSATITSSNAQPLYGAVNELNSSNGQGMAYTPFGTGSRIVDMPLLMYNNSGYYTGEQIQNVGSIPATLDFTVNGKVVDTRLVLPGQSTTWYGTNLLPTGSRVASGSVIAREEAARIVGIVNEVTAPQRPGDTSFVYEGFNR